MEAIYFGTSTSWGSGAGSGPWIMADLENGLFSGQSAKVNSADPTIDYRFVTAVVKGEANQWAIRGGNAASGSLSTFYSGARPSGYNPMHKEGAIILGIGGDNSKSAQGTFYEGVMTSGYPSDATENSVQANIVAAKYTTSSTGSGGSSGCTTALYGQCGGTGVYYLAEYHCRGLKHPLGFTGCTTCASGSTCTYSNACEFKHSIIHVLRHLIDHHTQTIPNACEQIRRRQSYVAISVRSAALSAIFGSIV